MPQFILNEWMIDSPVHRGHRDLVPAYEDIYKVFSFCKPSEIKVVILGQDPYYSVDYDLNLKANGLAFGVNPLYRGPRNSSIRNIQLELRNCGYDLEDLSLGSLAKQGVLLLNTQLTTMRGKPLFHKGIWDICIKNILKQIPADAVFLIWGNETAEVMAEAMNSSNTLFTSHPSSLSSTRTNYPFTGSKCFILVNEKLVSLGKSPIEWGRKL
jgi:uracil-DNA glycosylase